MRRRLLPITDTLFGRLALILLVLVLLTQALTVGLIWYERSIASRTMMLSYVTRDIASGIAILDRLPPQERKAWLARLGRNNYQYLLNSASDDLPQSSPLLGTLAKGVASQLSHQYTIREGLSVSGKPRLDLTLKDGMLLSIEIQPARIPLANWLPILLIVEFMLLGVGAWLAVRTAVRPLAKLGQAAEQLVPGHGNLPLAETGPLEVVKAARSFNAMQTRINAHLQERTRILAAISHDLQTPITRMRLRAELLQPEDQEKWLSDLQSMQSLVQEGIEYARSTEVPVEPPRKLNIDALIMAIVADYQDAGHNVSAMGQVERTLTTYPNDLRRIVINLIDNALKFAGAATVKITAEPKSVIIEVLDRGPGIPEDQLRAVLQPFYRLEQSRNPETGGSGLGLAIADQLTRKCGGLLVLHNRTAGGLCARLTLN